MRTFHGDVWQAFFAGNFGEADNRLLTRPDVLETMRIRANESARQGPEGYAEDEIAEAGAFGFSVADIRQEVHVWIREADPLPRSHADYMVEMIPRTTLVSFPDGGHLFPFDPWAEMLAALS